MTVKRLAAFKNPDLDSLTAVWLAQRFLFPGNTVEVVFVPRDYPRWQLADFDWAPEPTDAGLIGFDWGRKRSFLECYAASCCGKTWAFLQGLGRPVAHLIDLVHAIHFGGSGRLGAPLNRLYARLCAFFSKAKSCAGDETALYRDLVGWMDKYVAGLGLGTVAQVEWEKEKHRLPDERGAYAMILKTAAPGPLALGRNGAKGRMEVLPGFYAYSGSACQRRGGIAARYKHHLKPAVELDLLWLVDFLRLRCSIVEVWTTTEPSQSAFSREERRVRERQVAECVLETPGASVPVPKFGTPLRPCPAYLAYFESRPSFSAFRALARRPPLASPFRRLVLDGERQGGREANQ
jgi:Uri superfamily endonuclease